MFTNFHVASVLLPCFKNYILTQIHLKILKKCSGRCRVSDFLMNSAIEGVDKVFENAKEGNILLLKTVPS